MLNKELKRLNENHGQKLFGKSVKDYTVLQMNVSLNTWRSKAYKNLSEGTLLDYEIQISMLMFKRPYQFLRIQNLKF